MESPLEVELQLLLLLLGELLSLVTLLTLRFWLLSMPKRLLLCLLLRLLLSLLLLLLMPTLRFLLLRPCPLLLPLLLNLLLSRFSRYLS